MIGVIIVVSIVLYFISQIYFPLWTLISYIILSLPLALYNFYNNDFYQGIICILDILFFIFIYYRKNKLEKE